jgi:hypothetical protein
MIALARQCFRSRGAFKHRVCRSQLNLRSRDLQIATITVMPAALSRYKSKMGGGRNARATSFASSASSGNPPAIHPRESPAAAGSAAITQQAQKLTTCSLNPLSAILFCTATGKICSPVKNVWTRRLSCGSKRKTKNLTMFDIFLVVGSFKPHPTRATERPVVVRPQGLVSPCAGLERQGRL